jgi:hypothetical protein
VLRISRRRKGTGEEINDVESDENDVDEEEYEI